MVVFLARGFVQLHLYGDNATGWLAFARIAMGYPLFIVAAGFSFLVVTRARRRLAASSYTGIRPRSAARGFGLGQRHEQQLVARPRAVRRPSG